MKTIKAVLAAALVVVGCGGSRAVVGPSEPPPRVDTAPLTVPSTLRAVWAEPQDALRMAAGYQANAVVLIIDSWGADHTALAAELRQRGVGVLPYVEQAFGGPRGGWDAAWARVRAWDKPFRDAGLLFGYHVMDEPARRGVPQQMRDEANAYVRAQGVEVLATEWIDATKHPDYYAPKGVKWLATTCYDFGGTGDSRDPLKGVKWHFANCAGEYERHPEWNVVVGQAFDAGNGVPSRGQWEELAARLGRGIAWWAYAL